MTVHEIPDPALGNTSYLVELGGGLAAAVDPRRDVEEHLDLAERLRLRIVASVETHLHADFLTGSLELASATGAEIIAPQEGRLAFDHQGVTDGRQIELGDVALQALAAPGHTPEHVAYLLREGDDPVGVFTGGSLIVGGAARTDLVAAELTTELARAQFHSLRRLAGLPDATPVWPTHGAGSFCSAGPAASGRTTIGEERGANPLFALDDEDEFVRRLLAGYGSFPPYFLHLREVNRRGPGLAADLAPPVPLSPAEVATRVDEGAWLVDARSSDEWAVAHPRGAVSIALRPAFASWLGWVVPFGAPVVLLIEPTRVADAVNLARRIGYDGVVGWLDGGVEAWRGAGFPVDAVEEVDAARAGTRVAAGATLVDVRQRSEVELAHVPGALQIELGEIVGGKTPDAGDAVVFCAHGERSATAASLLERRGLRVANLAGGLEAWEQAGLPVAR